MCLLIQHALVPGVPSVLTHHPFHLPLFLSVVIVVLSSIFFCSSHLLPFLPAIPRVFPTLSFHSIASNPSHPTFLSSFPFFFSMKEDRFTPFFYYSLLFLRPSIFSVSPFIFPSRIIGSSYSFQKSPPHAH